MQKSQRTTELGQIIAVLIFAIVLSVLSVAGMAISTAIAASAAGGSDSSSTDSTGSTDTTVPVPDATTVAAACALAQPLMARGEEGDIARARDLLVAAGITDDNHETELASDDACEQVWVLSTPPESSSSTFETFGGAWDGFVEVTFTPLSSAAAFVAGGWLALFVLARLLVELPGARDLSSDRPARRSAGGVGWVLLILAPLLAVVLGAQGSGIPVSLRIFMWIALVTWGVISVISLALWLATMRVVNIEVNLDRAAGEGKQLSAALVSSYLRTIVGDSERIELPAGPAASQLASDLKDFSNASWVAAIQKIAVFLVGVAPWSASVIVQSDNVAVLTMTRNRSTIGVTPLRLDETGLESLNAKGADAPAAAAAPSTKKAPPAAPAISATKADFLAVLVAAQIIATLRAKYERELGPGLYGATIGTSIGLQYIAATWFATSLDTQTAQTLLSAALRRDPKNELARYSLEWVRHRQATDKKELLAFITHLDNWITAREARSDGRAGELLRSMVASRAAAVRNLAALALARRLGPCAFGVDTTEERDAIDRALPALRSLRDTAAEASPDSRDAQRLALTTAVLERARVVLAADAAPPAIATDLDSTLAGAGSATDDGAALQVIKDALTDDLFAHDAALAYSLATALVCWQRQAIGSGAVASRLAHAMRVPIYAEFSLIDPELATAKTIKKWRREHGA